MTVSWLGREGGESGESLKLSPLSSRRRYDITVSWLGEEGGPTRPYRPGESAMGGCPKKEFLSDASGRRVPRGKESEMKKMSGNLGVGLRVPSGERFRNYKSVWWIWCFCCLSQRLRVFWRHANDFPPTETGLHGSIGKSAFSAIAFAVFLQISQETPNKRGKHDFGLFCKIHVFHSKMRSYKMKRELSLQHVVFRKGPMF